MKFTSKTTLYLGLIGLISIVSCKQDEIKPEKENTPGIVLANMDTTVSPKADFYNYVNGSWMKNTKIPDDRTSWGGFGVLVKKTDQDVLNILAKAKESGKYTADTDQAKALFIFDSELDTVARDAAGIKPLQPSLDAIAGIKNMADLQTILATDAGVSAPYLGFQVFPNLSKSTINAGYVTPGGLGLPERDFYLEQDEKSKEIRQQYVAHITRMLQFLGDDEASAKEQATTVLAFETRLATPRFDKVQRRDVRNYNNPRSMDELGKMVSSIDWKKMISDIGLKKEVDTIIVMQPAYMEELQKVFTDTDIETLKTVMRWSTLNSAAGLLSKEIETANWEFYAKTLRGAKQQRPADERALGTVNGSVGEALGQLYVDEMFPPEAKAKAELMISNVIDAYKIRIKTLDWMSDSTKIQAVAKLNKFTVKIGYPNKWEDYSTLEVTKENTYFENMTAVGKWGLEDNLADYGEPVDKTKWGMSPQTVNAYFNPLNNEIVFPAAILQPPYYNYTADEAVNYGAIGAVIGHEISHAFDDSGARFDGDGNLNNWWTPADLEAFTKRGDALASQYSAIEVLDSVYINGKFTLGENIGDLGGVLGAYDGLQKFYVDNGRPDDIDGFTAEQRFFMSWATVWRTLTRDEALRTQIKTDPHSPGKTRAIQPLLNIDAFYTAFDIKEGDAMYLAPEKRVRIW